MDAPGAPSSWPSSVSSSCCRPRSSRPCSDTVSSRPCQPPSEEEETTTLKNLLERIARRSTETTPHDDQKGGPNTRSEEPDGLNEVPSKISPALLPLLTLKEHVLRLLRRGAHGACRGNSRKNGPEDPSAAAPSPVEDEPKLPPELPLFFMLSHLEDDGPVRLDGVEARCLRGDGLGAGRAEAGSLRGGAQRP